MFIGVVFCNPEKTPQERVLERLSDCEVVTTACAINSALQRQGHVTELVSIDPGRLSDLRKYDWIFNLTENTAGFPMTEYEIAHEMENLEIQFTGSSSSTLWACNHKLITKQKLIQAGIPSPAYEIFPPFQPCTHLTFPLIVKPIHEDGSIGITRDSVVRNMDDLERKAIEVIRVYHQQALVEEYIDGREINISLISSNNGFEVLPLSEIIFSESEDPKILTFESKWVANSYSYTHTTSRCPCYLEPGLEQEIKELVLRTVQLMECRDYVRVDMRLRDHKPFVLDVNPNPCLNPEDSGFIVAGSAGGYSFDKIIATILNQSLSRTRSLSNLVLVR